MRTRSLVLIGVVMALLSTQAVVADSSRIEAMPKPLDRPIQSYGEDNPACHEWTDGCRVCVKAEGKTACSTAGIACQPAGLTCKAMDKPAKELPPTGKP